MKKAASLVPNQRLRRERELRGWSQEDVAKKIGAPDDKTVRRWESGKVSPTPYYRQKLCALYGKSAEELGFIEENGLPTWNVPYRRNPFFTGREEVLTSLAQMLTADKWGALTQGISGLGGIGKTQIAVEYAYRHREQYRFILWVRAATPETLISDFVTLAVLLLRRAKLLANDATLDQASTQDRSNAEVIVKMVDGLPLALDQAGAYIEETACGLAAYLDLYQTRRKELLQRRGGLPTDHPEPVSTTWSLSFQQVEQANPAAADLLRLCAWLAPDAIPEEIITQGAAEPGPELGPVLTPAASDPFKLNEAIEVLQKFSLLRRDPETKVLSMHRLVQAVLQDGMDNALQCTWAERVVRVVSRVFPRVDFATWRQCQRYLPQALVCTALIEEWAMAFPGSGEALS